jgi:hypothetical protein
MCHIARVIAGNGYGRANEQIRATLTVTRMS